MVEIVNPQDVDLLETSCGSCNQHITVHELRRELEKFRERASLLSASTMGEAFDRLEELVEKEKELARYKEAWKRLPGNGGVKELFVEWEEEK